MAATGLRLVAPAMLCFLSAEAAAARCFEPLADFNSRQPKTDWKEFLDFPYPEKKAEGVVEFLKLDAGRAQANVDFYWITFPKPPNATGKDFFKKLRLLFPRFAAGNSWDYAFGPYEGSLAKDDPIRKANEELWNRDNPTGALMSFNLGGDLPEPIRHAGQVQWHEKAGDVQAICASDLDFVFATVKTQVGGTHPVSGMRGFGLIADPNAATWTFYSKAMDRSSSVWFSGAAYLKGLEGNNLFCLGHIFWIGFFEEIRAYLAEQRLKATELNLDNHGPVTYPFDDGPYPRLVCKVDKNKK